MLPREEHGLQLVEKPTIAAGGDGLGK